jgi:dienelactone hydrolase
MMPWRRLLAVVAIVIAGATAVSGTAAGAQAGTVRHDDLGHYIDESGAIRPISTIDDWMRRRAAVLEGVQQAMGTLPERESLIALDMEVLEEATLADGLVRQKIRYATEPDDRVTAYLFLPASARAAPRAAVLCLHQTTARGKDEPAGLDGSDDLWYAADLAARGFVTLAPDYPTFGEHPYDFGRSRWPSGSLKAVWDNMRAVDLLQGLSEVDAKRIGCIGHSLGGHNGIFTAVFDDRLKAVVSSCGFTRFHAYGGGDLRPWGKPLYMPRIAADYGSDPERVPFDFPELIAAIAPRSFFASAPVHDDNFDCDGVKEAIAAARGIYELHGEGDRLRAVHPDGGHGFPAAARDEAYRFLETQLRLDPPAKQPLTIGMIGLDTSHCLAFTELLNDHKSPRHVPGGRVRFVYPKGSPDIKSSVSRVPEYTQKIEAMGVEVVDDLEAMIARVDAVLLETNDGRPHLAQVIPVLRAGKPVFIDKPVAGSLTDAVAIYRLAEHHRVPCFSSSALRFAAATQQVRNGSLGAVVGCDTHSPCGLEPTHPDLFWYGIHGCEALFTVMGRGCRQVTRSQAIDGEFVTGVWKDGRIGTFRGLRGGPATFGGTAFGAKGTAAVAANDGYRLLLVEIVRFFETGTPPVEPEETLEIYAFMEAADESRRRGHVAVGLAEVMARAEAEAEATVRAALAR